MGCSGSTEAGGAPSSSTHGTKSGKMLPDFGMGATHESIKELGRGVEGVTWLMRDKRTNTEVAVKLLKRGDLPPAEYVVREIENQCNLRGHPCIVDLQEILLTPTHLAMSMEFVEGGDLLGLMDREPSGRLVENRVLYYFKAIILAVSFMHSRKVAHRDIKLENVFLTKDDPPRIKLGDFGFSRQWKANEAANMYTQVGTSVYMSPELLRISTSEGEGLAGSSDAATHNGMHSYDAEHADIWACGVLLYVMLLGQMPFQGRSVETVHRRVEKGLGSHLPFAGAYVPPKACSEECRDLISKILVPDDDGTADPAKPKDKEPKTRITIKDILAHPWLKRTLPEPFNGDPLAPSSVRAPVQGKAPSAPEGAVISESSLQKLVMDACHALKASEPRVLRSWKPPQHVGYKATMGAGGAGMARMLSSGPGPVPPKAEPAKVEPTRA